MFILPISNSQRGATLVEVLFGIAIFSSLVFIIGNFPKAVNLINSGNYRSLAKDIAEKQLESARNSAWSTLIDGTRTLTKTDDPQIATLARGDGQLIIKTCPDISITPPSICENVAADSLKFVQVNINWEENNETKTFTLTTLVAKEGLR